MRRSEEEKRFLSKVCEQVRWKQAHETIARDLSAHIEDQAEAFEKAGYGRLPVCVAKTQYSMSDNPALRGAPRDYELTVRSARLSAGAGFVVAFTGNIIAMPGLPKQPAALAIDVDGEGNITGLF